MIYRGWEITVHRKRMGWHAVANRVGARMPLATHTYSGLGSKRRSVDDIKVQIDIEEVLEQDGRHNGKTG